MTLASPNCLTSGPIPNAWTSKPTPPTARKVRPTSCVVQPKARSVHKPNTASVDAKMAIPHQEMRSSRQSSGLSLTKLTASP